MSMENREIKAAREFGELQARVGTLERVQIEMSSDIKIILKRTDRAFGMAQLLWLCAPAAVGAGLTWLFLK